MTNEIFSHIQFGQLNYKNVLGHCINNKTMTKHGHLMLFGLTLCSYLLAFHF